MEAQDWLVVTGIATATATLASLAFSLLWRRLDRKEADWIAVTPKAEWTAPQWVKGAIRGPLIEFAIANVGDSSGFQVRATGVGCHVDLSIPHNLRQDKRAMRGVIPSIGPGETAEVVVTCAPESWDKAFFVFTWMASPTRRRLRSRRAFAMPVREVASLPRYLAPLGTDSDGNVEQCPLEPPPGFQVLEHLRPQWPLPSGRPASWARWRTTRKLRRRARRLHS